MVGSIVVKLSYWWQVIVFKSRSQQILYKYQWSMFTFFFFSYIKILFINQA